MREFISSLKKRVAFRENPYFKALTEGTFSREDFVETQIQFSNAVLFFSRPIAVLAARLPRADMRLLLLENVEEEHGHGDLRFSHETTFLTLLERLGVTPAYAESRAMWPEVRAFNTILSGLCMLDDTFTGLAALGIIEDLFSEISGLIGHQLVARGWLPKDQIIHYAKHEVLDVAHAEGFYRPLEEPYRKNAVAAYQVQQGLELGAYCFLRMYRDLHEARARRWKRDIEGPHSMAAGSSGCWQ
jgi:pyrroloquinoline-quinone synthase